MNMQEAFDTALAGLRAQRRVSSNGLGCAYRGHEGLRCAVGFLVPDEMYRPEWDDPSFVHVNAQTPLHLIAEKLDLPLEFLSDLQGNLHDQFFCGGFNIEEMEAVAKLIASRYKLTYQEPTNA